MYIIVVPYSLYLYPLLIWQRILTLESRRVNKSHRNDIATGGGTKSHKTDIAAGSHAHYGYIASKSHLLATHNHNYTAWPCGLSCIIVYMYEMNH